MEKERIAKAFTDGKAFTNGKAQNFSFYDKSGEQYYKETYGGNNHLCCTPIGQIKRYVNCIGCDRKPLTYGGGEQ